MLALLMEIKETHDAKKESFERPDGCTALPAPVEIDQTSFDRPLCVDGFRSHLSEENDLVNEYLCKLCQGRINSSTYKHVR